jgi:hypothetical protein
VTKTGSDELTGTEKDVLAVEDALSGGDRLTEEYWTCDGLDTCLLPKLGDFRYCVGIGDGWSVEI